MLFCSLTKNVCKPNVLNRFVRFSHNDFYANILVPLKSRKLLKIHGEDASDFLQGLVTNDMRHFDEGAKSMYAMLLNSKGRVLYDTLIHKWECETFLMECDRSNFSQLLKHLNVYKLKRKVKMEDVNKNFNLWALISPVNLIPDAKLDPKSPINIYKDPRLNELGCRIVSASPLKGKQVVEMLGKEVRIEDEDVYKYLRYKLGVGEGAEDLPPGTCFPLEANCDYLHGVSFHKGCYLGQELTARIYHTGVIRKRLMPIKFFDEITDFIDKDTVIMVSNNPKSNVGKLKGFVHDYGLGLVKIKEALDAKTLNIADNLAEAIKPTWWPLEAPKEKLNVSKTD